MLMLIRAVPVYVALSLDKRENPLSSHHRVTVALYCTTALPIIVAVTSLAVKVGTMQSDTASTLVAAGAITVFLMPLLGSITYQVADVHPVTAVREIAHTHPIGGRLCANMRRYVRCCTIRTGSSVWRRRWNRWKSRRG